MDFEVEIEGKKVNMECDSGAVVTVMSLEEFREKFSFLTLTTKESNDHLRSFSGQKLNEVGWVKVRVAAIDLLILDLSRPFMSLFGRNWLGVSNWRKTLASPEVHIKTVSRENSLLNEIKSKFPRAVSTDLQKPIEGFSAELVLMLSLRILRFLR